VRDPAAALEEHLAQAHADRLRDVEETLALGARDRGEQLVGRGVAVVQEQSRVGVQKRLAKYTVPGSGARLVR
jgi:hypothetical protein